MIRVSLCLVSSSSVWSSRQETFVGDAEKNIIFYAFKVYIEMKKQKDHQVH